MNLNVDLRTRSDALATIATKENMMLSTELVRLVAGLLSELAMKATNVFSLPSGTLVEVIDRNGNYQVGLLEQWCSHLSPKDRLDAIMNDAKPETEVVVYVFGTSAKASKVSAVGVIELDKIRVRSDRVATHQDRVYPFVLTKKNGMAVHPLVHKEITGQYLGRGSTPKDMTFETSKAVKELAAKLAAPKPVKKKTATKAAKAEKGGSVRVR